MSGIGWGSSAHGGGANEVSEYPPVTAGQMAEGWVSLKVKDLDALRTALTEATARVAVLEKDIAAYRGALGYPVSGDHNGWLHDGTFPVNGIAEALDKQRDAMGEAWRGMVGELENAKEFIRKRYPGVSMDNSHIAPDALKILNQISEALAGAKAVMGA